MVDISGGCWKRLRHSGTCVGYQFVLVLAISLVAAPVDQDAAEPEVHPGWDLVQVFTVGVGDIDPLSGSLLRCWTMVAPVS